jgi:hypothetical protein
MMLTRLRGHGIDFVQIPPLFKYLLQVYEIDNAAQTRRSLGNGAPERGKEHPPFDAILINAPLTRPFS